jgi:hypothetical protein
VGLSAPRTSPNLEEASQYEQVLGEAIPMGLSELNFVTATVYIPVTIFTYLQFFLQGKQN